MRSKLFLLSELIVGWIPYFAFRFLVNFDRNTKKSAAIFRQHAYSWFFRFWSIWPKNENEMNWKLDHFQHQFNCSPYFMRKPFLVLNVHVKYALSKKDLLKRSIGELFFIKRMVFCYQNSSDLLWEKIVQVIENCFWNSRL